MAKSRYTMKNGVAKSVKTPHTYHGVWPDGSKRVWGDARATPEEAAKDRADALVAIQRGEYVDRARSTTVAGFLADYLIDLEHFAGTKRYRHVTFVSDRYRIRKHLMDRPEDKAGIGSVQLTKLGPSHIERLYASLEREGLSASTRRNIHTLLNKALKAAVANETLVRNPMERVHPNRIPEVPKNNAGVVLSADELARVREELANHWMGPLFVVLIDTGLRRSELCGLQWQDVDLDAGEITVRRSRKQVTGVGDVVDDPKSQYGARAIPLTGGAAAALRAWRRSRQEALLKLGGRLADDSWVAMDDTGEAIKPDLVSRTWARIRTVALGPDSKVRQHDLRHSLITAMYEQGTNLKTLQEIAGHHSPSFTQERYVVGSADAKRAAFDRLEGRG